MTLALSFLEYIVCIRVRGVCSWQYHLSCNFDLYHREIASVTIIKVTLRTPGFTGAVISVPIHTAVGIATGLPQKEERGDNSVKVA